MASPTAVVTEKPVLVTGAGGWLGSHVVYQLLEKGYKVRGTVRDVNNTKYNFLKEIHPKAETHLELVAADLTSDEGWTNAVDGVQYILHVASPFTFEYKNENEIIGPAVAGVERVFQAAFKSGSVKRIVQTSSVCAVVYGHPIERYTPDKQNNWTTFDETEWSVSEKIVGYEKSKAVAEKKAWELIEASDHKIELTTLCPAFIFGPIFDKIHGDGESSTQVRRVLLKTYPFVAPVDSSHVDVRDVALAHIKAMEGDSAVVGGQRFIIAATDGNITFQEQAHHLAVFFKQYGFNPPATVAPKFLVHIGKYFKASVRMAADKMHCRTGVNNTKATKVLGMTQWRSTADALKDHALSMMKYGALEPRKTPKEVYEQFKPY